MPKGIEGLLGMLKQVVKDGCSEDDCTCAGCRAERDVKLAMHYHILGKYIDPTCKDCDRSSKCSFRLIFNRMEDLYREGAEGFKIKDKNIGEFINDLNNMEEKIYESNCLTLERSKNKKLRGVSRKGITDLLITVIMTKHEFIDNDSVSLDELYKVGRSFEKTRVVYDLAKADEFIDAEFDKLNLKGDKDYLEFLRKELKNRFENFTIFEKLQ